METLLKFSAFFVFIIIIIISILLFIKLTYNTIPAPVSKFIEKNIFVKPTIEIDNKIIQLTPKQISQNAIDLFNYKHNKFLKNLNNSIQFCIDNNKFLLADNISKYKKLYLELYNIKIKLENNSKGNPIDYNSNEDFLLKSIQMDNLNNIIQKMN